MSFHRFSEQCAACANYYKNVTCKNISKFSLSSTEEVLQLASIILDSQCVVGESVAGESRCEVYKRQRVTGS